MDVTKAFGTVGDWFKAIISLGFTLIGAFLIVDILFPGTTGIVANVAALVSSFTSQGLVGLITLIVFVSILKD